MSRSILEDYAERELKYQARKEISSRIRKNCSDGDPMVSGITVMIGTILAMAVFSAVIGGGGRGRSR
jgi:hypothetical protein